MITVSGVTWAPGSMITVSMRPAVRALTTSEPFMFSTYTDVDSSHHSNGGQKWGDGARARPTLRMGRSQTSWSSSELAKSPAVNPRA